MARATTLRAREAGDSTLGATVAASGLLVALERGDGPDIAPRRCRQLCSVRLDGLEALDQPDREVLEATALFVERGWGVADGPLEGTGTGRRIGPRHDDRDGVDAVVERGGRLVEELAQNERQLIRG